MFLRGQQQPATKIWDQRSFDIFEALLPEERRATDEKRLKDIFDFAARVPVAAQALRWAQDHGVRFMIDHKMTGANAIYRLGMGVIALGLKSLEDPKTTKPFVIRQLTHEIRHMWQDYEGWLSHDKTIGFPHLCMVTNVTEADASAFGSLAQAQALDPGRYVKAEEANRFLTVAFGGWFGSAFPQIYGERASRITGAIYGLAEMKKSDGGGELAGITLCRRPPAKPLDFSDEVEVLRTIGKTFDGKNYIVGQEGEILFRSVFSRDLALCFHDSARAQPDELVLKICRHEENLRLLRQRAGLKW